MQPLLQNWRDGLRPIQDDTFPFQILNAKCHGCLGGFQLSITLSATGEAEAYTTGHKMHRMETDLKCSRHMRIFI
jgi:hypothetical protein